jgi:uncharacterized membrane protein YfcA
MFDLNALHLVSTQWVLLGVCALLVGITKTGVPGIGILCVPLMAMSFPARASTGILLPLLATADIFAVLYYRRHAHWNHVLRLLPWALLGLGSGSIIVRHISDLQLKPLIGFIVIVMLAINYWRQNRAGEELTVPKHWAFAASMGFTAGLTSQLANAAGPIMVIYLLAMGLSKNEFLGTSAWYFLILNWLKIPLFVYDGRITAASLRADLAVIPIIAIGAGLGIAIARYIPQKAFNKIVQLLALAAAVKLASSIF